MDYSHLLNTRSKDKWNSIGLNRRAGAAVPLFSVYSKDSIGIGEIPDIKLLIRWCNKTGISILQLLPMNDTGFDYAPYNSLSSFALEPMYLSLSGLKNVSLNLFKRQVRKLKKKYSEQRDRINYTIKQEKLEILSEIFRKTYTDSIPRFKKYKQKNSFWLEDYVLYKVIKEKHGNKNWEDFEDGLRDKDEKTITEFKKLKSHRLEFHRWIQWQLFEQLRLVKKYAAQNGVLMLGDLPFLVGRDSADVWANQKYFNLNLSSGAPPDVYFALGQKWGMPPYNWSAIENDGYIYLKEKIKYAAQFYDMYRIDHFIGLFRVWTVAIDSPPEHGGLYGKFEPEEEHLWENHGKKIIDVMIDNSEMLPVAEDLGTVPGCSGKTLWEYGIPGTNVQRWVKEKQEYYEFQKPEHYRINSAATISTHDSSTLIDWWYNEAGTMDKTLYYRLCKKCGIEETRCEELMNKLFDKSASSDGRLLWREEVVSPGHLQNILNSYTGEHYDFIEQYLYTYGEKQRYWNFLNGGEDYRNKIDVEFTRKALMSLSRSASIFTVNLIQEWLMLDEAFLRINEETSYRINYPGTVDDKNWTRVLPFSLEKILTLGINETILEINNSTNRNC